MEEVYISYNLQLISYNILKCNRVNSGFCGDCFNACIKILKQKWVIIQMLEIEEQGKKVCKVIALQYYQCFSLRFLLATSKWLNKKLHWSVVNCAGAQ